jgi:tetratricopeptide (TPR) repeat protein
LERRSPTIWSPATLDERTANAGEQGIVAELLGQAHFRLSATRRLMETAVCRGDLAEADKYLDLMTRLAAETRFHDASWSTRTGTDSWRLLLAGDIDEAEQAADEALRIANESGQPDAFAYYAGEIFSIRRAQGRLNEIIEFVEQAVTENPGLTAFRPALTVALCQVDRLEDARAVFEPLVERRFVDFPFNATWLTAMSLCSETASYLEHQPAALLMTDLLAPWRDQLAFSGVTCEGSVARPLGLAFTTVSGFEEADEAFEQAAAVHERINAPIELARTQVDWARMLASRARPGDHKKARDLLDAATNTAIALGLLAIQRQTKALLAKFTAT